MSSDKAALGELKLFAKEFDGELLSFVNEKKIRMKKLENRYELFGEIMEDFLLRGGKRLRPAFMYYGYSACGGVESQKIIKAAMSVELLHAFLLVHDDLIDRSDLRRGKAAVNKMFEGEYKKMGFMGDEGHFGISTAMILGDLVHAFAYEALMESGFSGERLVKARRLFDDLILETAYGWYAELLNTRSREVEEKLVEKSMEYVSARYTVSGPLKMGATLAGANQKQISCLDEYGLKLGTAFQIQDDILGMFGDEKKLGKPVVSDLKEGKKTLLVLRTLRRLRESGRSDEAERLLKLVGSSTVSRSDYEWVKNKMVDMGVLKEVKEEAKKLAKEAVGLVGRANFEKEGEGFLLGVADYIVEREV